MMAREYEAKKDRCLIGRAATKYRCAMLFITVASQTFPGSPEAGCEDSRQARRLIMAVPAVGLCRERFPLNVLCSIRKHTANKNKLNEEPCRTRPASCFSQSDKSDTCRASGLEGNSPLSPMSSSYWYSGIDCL